MYSLIGEQDIIDVTKKRWNPLFMVVLLVFWFFTFPCYVLNE
ncbi:hypothetical protein EMERY_41 [Brevibacillus phage Emery]|nr:hypothetical protein EMERY_41 [Brevibacillus phage Emery]